MDQILEKCQYDPWSNRIVAFADTEEQAAAQTTTPSM
jgi:hypothetical protein